jgi:hypothetical protein
MDDELNPLAAAALRAIANFDKVTITGLRVLEAFRETPDDQLRAAIMTLKSAAYVKQDPDHKEAPFVARPFAITHKGRRALRRIDQADTSRIAKPRTVDLSSTWAGDWQRPPVRAGALDAFTLPSLRGAERVAHAPPISLASGLQTKQSIWR